MILILLPVILKWNSGKLGEMGSNMESILLDWFLFFT